MTEVNDAGHEAEETANLEPVVDAAEASPQASGPASTLNADGRERPHFLLEFPADPELQRLVRAFEAGNYETVRVGAPRLAAATEDRIVRAAARELRRRIEPDPLLKYLLAVAVALFVFVVWYTYQEQTH
jgi:hypothetical protein